MLILAWVAYHAIRGLFKGMIRMICDLLAISLALFMAFQYAAPVNAHLSNWIQLPYTIGVWGAGLVIAGIIFVCISSIGKFLDTLTSSVGLGVFNRLAGFIFGGIKGFGFIIPLALILTITAPKQMENSFILSHYADVLSHFKGISFPGFPSSPDKNSVDLLPVLPENFLFPKQP
jgi:membrane protein required for colicin V production